MRHKELENQDQSKELATVSSRAKLYQAIQWHNSSGHLANNTQGIFISGFIVWILTNYTNIISNLTMKTCSSFSSDEAVVKDFVEFFIDFSLLLSILLTLKFASHSNIFSRFPIFIHENLTDPFDPNLLEKESIKEFNSIKNNKRKNFLLNFFGSYGMRSINTIAAGTLPVSPPSRKVMIAIAVSYLPGTYFLAKNMISAGHRYSTDQECSKLCDLINNLLRGTRVKLQLSSKETSSLLETNILSSFFGYVENANQSLIYFKRHIFEGYQDENYYIMLMLKQLLEEILKVTILALDDQAILVKVTQDYSLPEKELIAARNTVTKRFDFLNKKLKLSKKYQHLLNECSKMITDKVWTRIFDIGSADLFSFSLNVDKIKGELITSLMSDLKTLLLTDNVYLFGNKLVAEFELKKKYTPEQYAQLNKNISEIAPKSLFANLMTKTVSTPCLSELSEEEKTTIYKKIKPPKITGKNRFLFLHTKRPQVEAITWEKYKSYPLSSSPYFPLSHACSNKVIYYSAMTLSRNDFTEAEPMKMFLNILKSEVVKGSKAKGSCIKFVLMEERLSLKERIQNLAKDPKLILFKLHTKGDSRVYGVLRDEGIAEYDDGNKIKVKMIEWCIIDQDSHPDSTNIYHSTKNVYLKDSSKGLSNKS